MAEHVDVANQFFALLALGANLVVLATIVVLVAWAVAPGVRARLAPAVDVVGARATTLAFVVAAVTTAGSLYYSEVADFTPCLLCWYQRICMYPLVAILGVGALRRDRGVGLYALPFLVIGPVISTYHFLVERYPSLGGSLSCSADVPCTVPWFTEMGFVTLSYMALSAFLLIASLLALGALADRHGAPAGVDEADDVEDVDDHEGDHGASGPTDPPSPRIPELSPR